VVGVCVWVGVWCVYVCVCLDGTVILCWQLKVLCLAIVRCVCVCVSVYELLYVTLLLVLCGALGAVFHNFRTVLYFCPNCHSVNAP